MATFQSKNRRNIVLYAAIIVLAALVLLLTLLLIRSQPQEGGKVPVTHSPPPAVVRAMEEEPRHENRQERGLFEDLQELQNRLNQFFTMAQTHGTPVLRDLQSALQSDFFPPADLDEAKKAYRIQMDLPGFKKENIRVKLAGNQLSIEGTREEAREIQEEERGFYARERRGGSFARLFTLPGSVKEEEVTASYEDGVLTIILPKKDHPPTAIRPVEIQ